MLSEAPVQVQMDEAESQSSRSPPSSSKKEHISTEVVYLKSEVVRGVLQLHKVRDFKSSIRLAYGVSRSFAPEPR